MLCDEHLADRLIPRLIEELQSIPAEGSVLRSLFEGTLFPGEQGFYDIPGYRDLSHAASAANLEMQRLMEGQPELIKAADAYHDALTRMSGIDSFELFACGFGLAVRMVMEGIEKADRHYYAEQK